MGPDSGSFQHHARELGLYFPCPSKETHSFTTKGASGWIPRANLIGPRPKDILCPCCPGRMHPGLSAGRGGTSSTVSRHRPQPLAALNLAPHREETVLGGKLGACLGFLTLGKLRGFDSRMDTLVRTGKAQIQVRKDIVLSTKRETIPPPGESSASLQPPCRILFLVVPAHLRKRGSLASRLVSLWATLSFSVRQVGLDGFWALFQRCPRVLIFHLAVCTQEGGER